MNEQAIIKIVNDVIAELLPKKEATPTPNEIPIGISARHIHLQQEHVERLFGKGATLSVKNVSSTRSVCRHMKRYRWWDQKEASKMYVY